MNGLIFQDDGETVTIDEYFDIIDFLDRNLVIGIELEREFNHGSYWGSSNIASLFNAYQGRGDLTEYQRARQNKYNIAFVYSDPSVGNGAEIVFNGTSENFAWIHNKLKKIEDKLSENGCKTFSNRCSNHITAKTLQNKLLKPLIVKNVVNITRAFSSALYWLGSGNKDAIVRDNINRFASPRLGTTPRTKDMSRLRTEFSKFSLLNLAKQTSIITGDEMASGLTLEWRNVDGIRSPLSITSLVFLYRAIVYKSVELSIKGLVNVESLTDWEKNKEETNKILHERVCDCDFVQDQAKALISFLEPQLKKLAPQSIPVLNELADYPMSVRHKKKNLKQIEKELSSSLDKKLTDNEKKLIMIIVEQSVIADTTTKWKTKASEFIGCSTRMIEYMIQKIENSYNKRVVFDKDMKLYRLI